MAFWKNRLLLAGIETVYGTAPSLAGTDAMLISEIDVTPLEVDLKDRGLIRGAFGNTEKVISGRMSKATFSVEVAGSGTVATAPKWGASMRACGFSQTIVPISPGPGSVTYALVSSAQESISYQFFADGTAHILRGCRGTVSMEQTAGEISKFNFEMTGLYTQETATTNPAATFTAQAKPVAMNSDNTTPVSVHGFAACLQSLSLDLANVVTYRQLAGCTQKVQITDRLPTGSLSIEAPALGSKNYFAALSSQTLGALSFQHGQTTGNIVTVSMPAINIGGVAYEDSDGILMLSMEYMPNPVNGNDEIVITLT